MKADDVLAVVVSYNGLRYSGALDARRGFPGAAAHEFPGGAGGAQGHVCRLSLLALFLPVRGLIAVNRGHLQISIGDLTFYFLVAVFGLLGASPAPSTAMLLATFLQT